MPDGFGDGMTTTELSVWTHGLGGGQSLSDARRRIGTMESAFILHLRIDHDYTIKQIADLTGIKFSIVREVVNAAQA